MLIQQRIHTGTTPTKPWQVTWVQTVGQGDTETDIQADIT